MCVCLCMCVCVGVWVGVCSYVHICHDPHYTAYKAYTDLHKNIKITRCYCIFPVPGKKKKSKPKQSRIKVNIIMKMKKHNLCGNCQIVFMSDTRKQRLIDLYEILIIKN